MNLKNSRYILSMAINSGCKTVAQFAQFVDNCEKKGIYLK